MDAKEYWAECIAIAAEECELPISKEQLEYVADAVAGGHENYGMAFYSPPSSDRYNQIDREWKQKYDALQAEFDRYRGNAETAVKRALRQQPDVPVSIGEYGEVTRWGGRATRIQ